jgi:hypothetical protein
MLTGFTGRQVRTQLFKAIAIPVGIMILVIVAGPV